MKKFLFAIALVGLAALGACSNDADVASRNISQAADNFEVAREVTFINGITNEGMLSIKGYCSLGVGQAVKAVTVTCKTGPGKYVKHYLGLSDNVTYIAKQIEDASVSSSRYRVTFKPSVVIPDIDVR